MTFDQLEVLMFDQQLQVVLDRWRMEVQPEQDLLAELASIISDMHRNRRRAFERLARFEKAMPGSDARRAR